MAAGVFPDAWEEVGLVTIQQAGGTARQVNAIVTDVKIDQPDYPGESIVNTGGGRIWNQKPQEDGEVTLEMYPISADEGDNFGLDQYYGGGSIDSSQPITTNTSFTAGISKQRETYCVAVLFTDDTAFTSAFGTGSTSAKVAYRWYCKLARLVSYKKSFNPSDGWKATATFKFPPMNKAGTIKVFKEQSSNDLSTAPFPALLYTAVANYGNNTTTAPTME